MRRVFAATIVGVAALALPWLASAGVEEQLVATTLDAVACTEDGLCQGTLTYNGDQVGSVTAVRSDGNVTVTVTTSDLWPIGQAWLSIPAIPHSVTQSFAPPFPTATTFGPFQAPSDECLQLRVVVTKGVLVDTVGLTDSLPYFVDIRSTQQGGGYYWNLVLSNGRESDGTPNSAINGSFGGWCVDVGHTWGGGTVTARVYSGYPNTGIPNVDHPENLDLVNWVLNNFEPGDALPDGLGVVTWADLQKAFWHLVDDEPGSTSGLPSGGWSQLRVNYIVAAALAWPGPRPYVPPCGGLLAIILAPVNGAQAVIAQVVAIQLPTNCPTPPPTAEACFTCCLKGSLSISKAVNIIRHIPATESFEICILGPSYPVTPNCKTFTAGQTLTWADLLRGSYTITETISEVGWTILVDASPVSVVGGQTATAAVTNNYQFCTLTPGYWKTHSEYGPAPHDDTWALLLPAGEDSPFFDSGKTYYQVLWTNPSGGNAYYILAHAFIAAELNSLGGLTSISEVDAAMAWCRTFFTDRHPEAKLSKDLRAQALAIATLLDNYNNGLIGPGHCD